MSQQLVYTNFTKTLYFLAKSIQEFLQCAVRSEKKVLNSHISHSFKHDYGFKSLHTCENVCRGYRVIDSIAANIKL